MRETILILWHFAVARWLPEVRPSRRAKKLRRFLAKVRRESPYYRHCEGEFPILSKAEFLASFAELNRHGISLETATELALRAERERDFVPQLPGGITVGLSSGTSGTRHVFLVGRAERCLWAGQIFGRMLEPASLRQILNPLSSPLRLAFFLRASSNLYTTLGSRRVHFDYYDLTHPFTDLIARLEAHPPEILIAPATVLAEIAKRAPSLRPRQALSVAEVLDGRDRERIERAFQVPVREIYQAAEGFLGYTCPEGRLHLNEEILHIEPLWLDEHHERFHPIITDFSRSTQHFVRYRLDDVLRLDPRPCPCGRSTRTLLAIEGRAEEVLWLPDSTGALSPIFPDVIRQAIYTLESPPEHYRIEQQGDLWKVRMRGGNEAQLGTALEDLAGRLALRIPDIIFLPWTEQAASEKQKRIRCLTRPS